MKRQMKTRNAWKSLAFRCMIFAANEGYKTKAWWYSDFSNSSLSHFATIYFAHISDWLCCFRSAAMKKLAGQQASLTTKLLSRDKTYLHVCKSGWHTSCDNVNSSNCHAVTTSFLALSFLCRLLTSEHVYTALTFSVCFASPHFIAKSSLGIHPLILGAMIGKISANMTSRQSGNPLANSPSMPS